MDTIAPATESGIINPRLFVTSLYTQFSMSILTKHTAAMLIVICA